MKDLVRDPGIRWLLTIAVAVVGVALILWKRNRRGK